MDLARYTNSTWGQARPVPGLGYVAFYPALLPRTLPMSADAVRLLADAEAALGRLAGVGRLVPNPHLLIRPYLMREALSSSRMEGTQASLSELLELEAAGGSPNPDLEEVLNYISAMETGLERIADLPFSIRLICEMHQILMDGVRGRDRLPGEIRSTQNWLGPPGATLGDAVFVPPPPGELSDLLSDWERFAHDKHQIPVLAESALLHYQFETIHPFLDGNGRLGRLAIIFHLIVRERLPSPLLYLSSYFEKEKDEYVACLQAVREDGDVDRWMRFFFSAVEAQATDAVVRAERIVDLRENYRDRVMAATRSQAVGLVDVVFASPILSAKTVEAHFDVRRPTALRMLEQLVGLGILDELESGLRNLRRFVAREVLATIDEGSTT